MDMTLTQIVITAVAAVLVFVAVLVGVLTVGRRRARPRGAEYESAPGYGRPDGYGPPPLWTDVPSDQRSGGS